MFIILLIFNVSVNEKLGYGVYIIYVKKWFII